MARPPRITLIGLEGPVAGRQYTFEGPQVVLGRGQGCHIIVGSSFVSRRHCELRVQNGRWELRDLNARNPARLNGGIPSGPVRPGDVLSLADARFRIELPTVWSREECPTQLINARAELMKEYAALQQRVRGSSQRPARGGAQTPRTGAEVPPLEPSTAPDGTTEASVPHHTPTRDLTGLAIAMQLSDRGGPRPLLGRYVPMLSRSRTRPTPSVGNPPPVFDEGIPTSEPGQTRARLHVPSAPPPQPALPSDLQALVMQHEALRDDEPTVSFPLDDVRKRSWRWLLPIAGLLLVLLGVRSCAQGHEETFVRSSRAFLQPVIHYPGPTRQS